MKYFLSYSVLVPKPDNTIIPVNTPEAERRGSCPSWFRARCLIQKEATLGSRTGLKISYSTGTPIRSSVGVGVCEGGDCLKTYLFLFSFPVADSTGGKE